MGGGVTVTAQRDLAVANCDAPAGENVTARADKLILSLFPGIDLFSKPFEALGFCVVRGPELAFGQDIRDFHVPAGVFAGVIGGPPCQEFSLLRREEPTGYGLEMLQEYRRVVTEAAPDWWLMENVANVPDLKIDSYSWQRFDLNQAWYSDYSRLRHFQFGHKAGKLLNPPKVTGRTAANGAALASDNRSFAALCHAQGLPDGFELPSFNVEGKKRAVGNGVPLVLGRVLAELINQDVYGVTAQRHLSAEKCDTAGALNVTAPGKKKRCLCGCGRIAVGRQKYADQACRKRAQRQRGA